MSIQKVASLFEGKLSLANDKLSEDLRKIMIATSDLAKTYDLYDDAYNAVQNLASKAYQYWKMSVNPTQAIPANTISGWMKNLVNSVANTAKAATDPTGQTKIRTINNLISSVQPMDIGPKPEEGSSYPQHSGTGPWKEDLGADEAGLHDVVKNMAPKPNPWDPEAQEPWKVDF
ncbi:MAG TPA: hypothetical protein VM577_19310 [Anaerovoracaceae bacterium]|nr:hypothetical protein [Anaerovoracaceae bacterium]